MIQTLRILLDFRKAENTRLAASVSLRFSQVPQYPKYLDHSIQTWESIWYFLNNFGNKLLTKSYSYTRCFGGETKVNTRRPWRSFIRLHLFKNVKEEKLNRSVFILRLMICGFVQILKRNILFIAI